MPDEVRILCPSLLCRRVLVVPNNARGKTVRCRNCGTNIRVPVAGENMKDGRKPAASEKPKAA